MSAMIILCGLRTSNDDLNYWDPLLYKVIILIVHLIGTTSLVNIMYPLLANPCIYVNNYLPLIAKAGSRFAFQH